MVSSRPCSRNAGYDDDLGSSAGDALRRCRRGAWTPARRGGRRRGGGTGSAAHDARCDRRRDRSRPCRDGTSGPRPPRRRAGGAGIARLADGVPVELPVGAHRSGAGLRRDVAGRQPAGGHGDLPAPHGGHPSVGCLRLPRRIGARRAPVRDERAPRASPAWRRADRRRARARHRGAASRVSAAVPGDDRHRARAVGRRAARGARLRPGATAGRDRHARALGPPRRYRRASGCPRTAPGGRAALHRHGGRGDGADARPRRRALRAVCVRAAGASGIPR